MGAALIGVFVALLAALALGIGMGFLLGRGRERELVDRFERAQADLEAHAVELADANEEITCLLDELHEARHRDDDPGLRSG